MLSHCSAGVVSGKRFPIISNSIIGVLPGMIITLFWNERKGRAGAGIKVHFKICLQAAVVSGVPALSGVVLQTGSRSL